MNKRERERLHQQVNTLQSLGFTYDEAEQLRRISRTLQRWYELECGTDGGCIERDEFSGIPQWRRADDSGKLYGRPIPDRERGAMKRLAKIVGARNARTMNPDDRHYGKVTLSTFIQSDPRGAALYIIRPGDVPEGASVESCYNRGVCVY